MAVNKVDITVSEIINDLNNGLTWLKRDDLGYGSIETKYGANEKQIMAIRKHPKLKDAETSVTIFNIIDDTSNESHSDQMVEVMNNDVERAIENFAPIKKVLDDSFSAFASL